MWTAMNDLQLHNEKTNEKLLQGMKNRLSDL